MSTERKLKPNDALETGHIRCTSCGARWHGEYPTGFWQRNGDGWLHWCSAGTPGTWAKCEEEGDAD